MTQRTDEQHNPFKEVFCQTVWGGMPMAKVSIHEDYPKEPKHDPDDHLPSVYKNIPIEVCVAGKCVTTTLDRIIENQRPLPTNPTEISNKVVPTTSGDEELETMENIIKEASASFGLTADKTVVEVPSLEFAAWMDKLLDAMKKEIAAAKAEERERCLKALPDEYIIHDYMPHENTPARQGWNDYRAAAIKAITNQ